MKIGLLENAEICYNSLTYFERCIESALNKLGNETQRIPELNGDVFAAEYDAIVGINTFFAY